MIPLRSSAGLRKFPFAVLYFLIFLAVLNSFFLFTSDLSFAIFDNKNWGLFFWVFPGFISLLVNLIFLWVFLPSTLEKINPLKVFSVSLVSYFLTVYLYKLINPEDFNFIMGSVWVASLIGVCLTRAIWDGIDTVVYSIFFIRVYSVPSYVIVFFWLFYHLILGFIYPKVWSENPNSYFLILLPIILSFVLTKLCDLIESKYSIKAK